MIHWRFRMLTLAVASGSVLVPSGRAHEPVPLFEDATAAAGITFVHQSAATPDKFMMETFGSGVAWIDIDNDGFQDLLFVNGAPGASNILYKNNRNGTFSNVTAQSGTAGTSTKAYKTEWRSGTTTTTGCSISS